MTAININTFEFKNRVSYYKMLPKLSSREVEVLALSAFGLLLSGRKSGLKR